ncbi:MAG: hypothetical protein R2762_08465 [Bryobacteraceae bacterium]
MTLNDLRKYAVRNQTQIRYRLANGLDCLVDSSGIARVPGFQGLPDFNLEQELANAAHFAVEAPPASPKRLTRLELETLTTGSGAATAAPAPEEDE